MELTDQLQTERSRAQRLQAALDSSGHAADALRPELERALTEAAQSRRRVAELEAEQRALLDRVADAERRIPELQAEHRALLDRFARADRRLPELEAEHRALQDRLAKAVAAEAAAQAAAATAMAEAAAAAAAAATATAAARERASVQQPSPTSLLPSAQQPTPSSSLPAQASPLSGASEGSPLPTVSLMAMAEVKSKLAMALSEKSQLEDERVWLTEQLDDERRTVVGGRHVRDRYGRLRHVERRVDRVAAGRLDDDRRLRRGVPRGVLRVEGEPHGLTGRHRGRPG